MFNEETKRKLRLMRLDGLIEAEEQLKIEPGLENLSFDERFQVLIDSEFVPKCVRSFFCCVLLNHVGLCGSM